MQAWTTALLALAAASSAEQQAWNDWVRLSDARCPSHHVKWVCDSCYLGLVESFEATLSKAQRLRVDRIADIKHECASEQIGFSCEASRSFLAYKEQALMARFVRHGCKVVKCEEVALCSRMPPDS